MPHVCTILTYNYWGRWLQSHLYDTDKSSSKDNAEQQKNCEFITVHKLHCTIHIHEHTFITHYTLKQTDKEELENEISRKVDYTVQLYFVSQQTVIGLCFSMDSLNSSSTVPVFLLLSHELWFLLLPIAAHCSQGTY